MRVMRSNLDGSKIETLIDTSEGDARPGKDIKKWCVGIALDQSFIAITNEAAIHGLGNSSGILLVCSGRNVGCVAHPLGIYARSAIATVAWS